MIENNCEIKRLEDLPEVKELINKNIGRNKWKWLEKQGVQLVKSDIYDPVETNRSYEIYIYTKDKEYIGLLDLPKQCQDTINFIYKHKLTQLSSISMATKGKLDECGCNAVSIGFNEKEQCWYGWTHGGFGKFYVGYEIKKDSIMDTCKTPYPYKVETLEQAKQLAIDIANYLN